jgi:hypothetical protein
MPVITLLLAIVACFGFFHGNAQAEGAPKATPPAAGKIVPFRGALPEAPTPSGPSSCALPAKLPPGTVVLAAGAYSGRKISRQIDQSGHEATQFDVTVNSKKPVALFLSAYEPSIWNVGWTEGTEIVAVLVSGYHRQALAGIPEKTPVLNSSYDNKGACGYVYMASDQMGKVNSLSQRVFGATVATAFAAQNGAALVGDALNPAQKIVTSDWKTVESYFDKNAPLAGKPGLDDGVKKGLLRLATKTDLKNVKEAMDAAAGKPKANTKLVGFNESDSEGGRMFGIGETYVVLKKFTYPAGLYGGHSVVFIIEKGAPAPAGNPGHSQVYDLNKVPVCQGPMCRMFEDQ